MIEVGKKFPSASMLERIALALNVDTPELFTSNSVIFMPNNKSIERMYQEVLLEFKQFEKTITENQVREIKNGAWRRFEPACE